MMDKTVFTAEAKAKRLLEARDTLIEVIRRVCPEVLCRSGKSEEFDGAEGGVWLSGETGHIDYHSGYVEPALQAAIQAAGFFLEPHDPGTYFAWKI